MPEPIDGSEHRPIDDGDPGPAQPREAHEFAQQQHPRADKQGECDPANQRRGGKVREPGHSSDSRGAGERVTKQGAPMLAPQCLRTAIAPPLRETGAGGWRPAF
jgi:hypothetical protein